MSGQKYAFASYVDRNYIDGFIVLLSSTILNNLDRDYDFVVFYDDLTYHDRQKIAQRYNRIVFKKIDTAPYATFKKGLASNYLVEKAYYILEAFRLSEYETVVSLDTDMVVLKPITELFDLSEPFSACPQFINAQGGRNLNSGLLVINKPLLGAEVWKALCEVGRAGKYELEKHDQGILSAYFDGNYNKLHHIYNTVKRRLLKKDVPKNVKILHFTGPIKPWVDSEVNYEKLQSVWSAYDLNDALYLERLLPAAVSARNYETAMFALRSYTARYGASPMMALRAFPALRALNLWDEARKLLEDAPIKPTARDYGRYLRYLGETYSALGDTDGTGAMYLAASKSLGQPVEKLLANAAWVGRRMSFAEMMASVCLEQKPTARDNRVIARRMALTQTLEAEAEEARASEGAMSHAAFYMNRQGNAGDVMLPWSVRGAIETGIGPSKWAPVHVHQSVTDEVIDRINATRGLVIGGGGLFLADTGRNGRSGWQWNISAAQMKRINVPINVFAVGYNQFYGQGRLSDVFTESVSTLLEKSHFFGLRNSGSINSLKSYVSDALAEKVAYQPCPTTVLAKTHPHLFEAERREDYIALNIALDRTGLRFGESYEDFLSKMARFIREISKAMPVLYFAHAVVDERFLIDLARHEGLALQAVRLYDLTVEEMVELYQEPRVVIGMRGHAGMIPFGCRTPIISIVTHPKLRYFLEDVNMPECAIEVDDTFIDALLAQTRQMLADHDGWVARVDTEIERLWTITRKNVDTIRLGLTR